MFGLEFDADQTMVLVLAGAGTNSSLEFLRSPKCSSSSSSDVGVVVEGYAIASVLGCGGGDDNGVGC